MEVRLKALARPAKLAWFERFQATTAVGAGDTRCRIGQSGEATCTSLNLTFQLQRQVQLILRPASVECDDYDFFLPRREAAAIECCAT